MFHCSPNMVETRPTPPPDLKPKPRNQKFHSTARSKRTPYLNPIFTYDKNSVLIGHKWIKSPKNDFTW